MLEASIEEYQEAIRIQPDHGRPYDTICWCHNTRGEYDQTILWGNRGIALFPDHARLHSHLVTAYLAAGRLEQGTAELEEVLRLEPENTSASVNLGLIHYKQGDLGNAARRFAANLEIAGASPQFYLLSHIHLGLIALEVGLWSEALDAFQSALDVDSDDFDGCLQLAFTHSRLRDQASLEAALQGLLASGRDRGQAEIDLIVTRLRDILAPPN